MGQLFGTDGIRGEANITLTGELAEKIGRFCGYRFSLEQRGKIIIGSDTRLSSSMLEAALTLGITEAGSDVYVLGVCSTPNISYLLSIHDEFDCGIMISASHNVYSDNGIKIFMKGGYKIDETLQMEVSQAILNNTEIPYALKDKIGVSHNYSEGVLEYYSYLKSLFDFDLSGLKIGLDLANGSATAGAKDLFESFKAEVVTIADEPNGVNINNKCGSTHIENLQKLVLKEKCDIGFAFDGDADRVIAVAEDGSVVDGDKILYLCGLYKQKRGLLKDDTIVTTQMSNYGLYKAFQKAQLNSVVTSVGDKYVYEAMDLDGYVLGGEQSGHIIFKRFANTGDGQLAALKILEVIVSEKVKLSVLVDAVKTYPQILENVRVMNKQLIIKHPALEKIINEITNEINGEGRVLVRPSGTEELIRVMVEAKTLELCQKYVSSIIKEIKEISESN